MGKSTNRKHSFVSVPTAHDALRLLGKMAAPTTNMEVLRSFVSYVSTLTLILSAVFASMKDEPIKITICLPCFPRANVVIGKDAKRPSATLEEAQLTSGTRDGDHVQLLVCCQRMHILFGFLVHFPSLLNGAPALLKPVEQGAVFLARQLRHRGRMRLAAFHRLWPIVNSSLHYGYGGILQEIQNSIVNQPPGQRPTVSLVVAHWLHPSQFTGMPKKVAMIEECTDD